MELMLEKLNHPEKQNQFIHIAGTNGKGSTLTFLSKVLEKEGYRVGTFTSPFIETFNERIAINGVPISDTDIVNLANRIAPITEEIAASEWGPPSEFEIITAMMFLYFAEYDTIDFGVIEVGLGGRLDSTNVLIPILSIITTIGLDHMEFLGNSIEEIAAEKGGIIKPRVPVVAGVTQQTVIATLKEIAAKQGAGFYLFHQDFTVEKVDNQLMNYRDKKHEIVEIALGLRGDHQMQNAAVAIFALEYLAAEGYIHLSESGLRKGLQDAFWPGRLEKIGSRPAFILDGAHNPEGIRALIEALKQNQTEQVTLLFSALEDKKYREMIEVILKDVPNIDFHLTTFDFPRAMTHEQVDQIASDYAVTAEHQWTDFLDQKYAEHAGGPIYITGSLYFISEVRKYLINK